MRANATAFSSRKSNATPLHLTNSDTVYIPMSCLIFSISTHAQTLPLTCSVISPDAALYLSMSCRRAAERVYPYRSKTSQSVAWAAGTAVRDVTVMSAVRAVTSLTSGCPQGAVKIGV